MSMGSEDARDPRDVRHNLGALTLDVTFFALGMAFLDGSAVMPLLLVRLGANSLAVGAFAALHTAAFSGLQIFVAYGTHWQPRQKPWLASVAMVTRLPLLLFPLFILHAGDSPAARSTALVATFVILNLWALGDGLGYVPWMEIVARAFSDRTRGRFFATTQFVSGLGAIVIAGIVRQILHSPHLPYPSNYALLAGIAAIMFQISMAGVLLIREPAAPAASLAARRPALAVYFRRLPVLVRENPVFGRLALIQLLIGFGAASAPFYVLYATRRFHLGDEWGGVYQLFAAVGVVALMPVWTLLSERRGPATAVRALALTCLLTPLLALTLGALSPGLFGLVFLLMGGSLGWGLWIVLNHYLLSHIPEEERSIFVALINLLFLPSALFPTIGGLFLRNFHFVTLFGVPALFLLTSVVTGAGLLLSLGLPAPDSAPTPA